MFTGPPESAYCEPFVQFTAREFDEYTVAKPDLTAAYLRKSADNNLIFKREFKVGVAIGYRSFIHFITTFEHRNTKD